MNVAFSDGESRISSIFRGFAAPIGLIVFALATVFAAEVTTRLQVSLHDLLGAHGAAVQAGARSFEQLMSLSVERMQAARLLAGRVSSWMAVASLVGGLGFLILGRASRVVRISTFVIVLGLLIRAFFWEVV